jgi:hypothetical protein
MNMAMPDPSAPLKPSILRQFGRFEFQAGFPAIALLMFSQNRLVRPSFALDFDVLHLP